MSNKKKKIMAKKTSKHFRPAAINSERHNKREKDLSHVRHDLQTEDHKQWMWEAPDKKSVYAMRKQAEREYQAVKVVEEQAKDGKTVRRPVIDAAKCVGCGACAHCCPADAIAIRP